MLLDSGDLDLAKPVRQAQADAADPAPRSRIRPLSVPTAAARSTASVPTR